jgi:fructose-1,6-bisphosphatase/inositol monophosphatase family enzyme
MGQHTRQHIEASIQALARQAGRLALDLQPNLGDLTVKGGGELGASSIVTEADRALRHLAKDWFATRLPDCLVLQEEMESQADFSRVGSGTPIFVLAPIDGTLFYANSGFARTVSVGCFIGGGASAGCGHLSGI